MSIYERADLFCPIIKKLCKKVVKNPIELAVVKDRSRVGLVAAPPASQPAMAWLLINAGYLFIGSFSVASHICLGTFFFFLSF